MKKYNFEKLDVWTLSVQGIKATDSLVKKFPKEELFILSDQIRRAALSVSLNIAEGSGRGSKLDFKRFIRNSIGSVLEIAAGIRIALSKEYVAESDADTVDALYAELYFKLIALEKYLKR